MRAYGTHFFSTENRGLCAAAPVACRHRPQSGKTKIPIGVARKKRILAKSGHFPGQNGQYCRGLPPAPKPGFCAIVAILKPSSTLARKAEYCAGQYIFLFSKPYAGHQLILRRNGPLYRFRLGTIRLDRDDDRNLTGLAAICLKCGGANVHIRRPIRGNSSHRCDFRNARICENANQITDSVRDSGEAGRRGQLVPTMCGHFQKDPGAKIGSEPGRALKSRSGRQARERIGRRTRDGLSCTSGSTGVIDSPLLQLHPQTRGACRA